MRDLQYSNGGCIQPESQKKAVHFSLLFDLSLQSLNLHQYWLNFFFVTQHLHIPYALRCLCVYWYHFLHHVKHWNRFHTQYMKQNLHIPGFLNEFEFITPQIDEFHKMFLYLWRNWLWIVRYLSYIVLTFFEVPILLGNNWKINLKWKQN